MNRSFNFFAFISLLGRWRNPPHHYLVHRTQTQTHNNTLMKLRDSSMFWPAGSNPGRTDVDSAPQDKLLYRRQSWRTIKSLNMTTMMIKHGWSKSSLMYYYRCLGEGLRLSPTSARDRISLIMWREGSAILCGFISKCMSALTGVLSKWRGTEGHKSFLRETSHSCYTQCNDCESFYSTLCGPLFYGVRLTLSLINSRHQSLATLPTIDRKFIKSKFLFFPFLLEIASISCLMYLKDWGDIPGLSFHWLKTQEMNPLWGNNDKCVFPW